MHFVDKVCAGPLEPNLAQILCSICSICQLARSLRLDFDKTQLERIFHAKRIQNASKMHRNAELSRTSNYTTQRPNDPTTRINGQTRLHFRWWLGPRPARPPAKRQTVLWALPCIWRSSAVSRLAELQRKCQVNRYISSSKCYDTTLLGLYFVHLCTLFSRTTNCGIVSCALFSSSHDGSRTLRSISLFFLEYANIEHVQISSNLAFNFQIISWSTIILPVFFRVFTWFDQLYPCFFINRVW